jgi:hypothetical protein
MAYTTIDNPGIYFNTVLWTGNGASSRAITGVGFSPNWVWAKQSGQAIGHVLYDSVRGAGSDKELVSNSSNAEGAGNPDTYGYLSSFDSDGFTGVDGSGSPNYYFNENSQTFVAWNWKESATAGFDIVSYTGNGSARTISHSLSAAPNFMIIKNRDAARSWNVYFGDPTDYIYLNDTSAAADYNEIWNDTAPTSSVFSVGTDNGVNQSSEKYIGYLFAEKKGYSKFGSYTGNGNAEGPFIHLGFRPAWLLVRNKTSGSENWAIYDNKRDSFNTVFNASFPNRSNADGTNATQNLDFLSNGFKCKSAEGRFNASGNTMIYMAFAESPFVNSKGIPNNGR